MRGAKRCLCVAEKILKMMDVGKDIGAAREEQISAVVVQDVNSFTIVVDWDRRLRDVLNIVSNVPKNGDRLPLTVTKRITI